MARLTNAQLVDQLSALREAYARLQAEYESLRASVPKHRTPPPPAVSEYRQRLAQARAQAMATGCSVLVTK